MRLSTRGEYASRAMLELALNWPHRPLHIRDISRAQHIPERFLEQILLLLKRAGHLRSRKGPNGGYQLARPPAEITVAEVIRVMDGPLAPIDCVSVTAHEVCPLEDSCGLRWLWKDVRDAVARILERTTFADLARKARPGRTTGGSRARTGRGGVRIRAGFLAALTLGGSFWAPALRAEDKPSAAVQVAVPLKISAFGQVQYGRVGGGTDTLSIPRVRLSLESQVTRTLRFKVQADATRTPVLIDANMDLTLFKGGLLRFGQFKVPFSQESLTPASDHDTINLPRSVQSLSPGRDIGASGRDIGAYIQCRSGRLEVVAGVFNGAGINKSDTNRQKDLAGRLVFSPAKLLRLGASVYKGSYSAAAGNPAVRRDRVGMELAADISPVNLKAEYILGWDGEISKRGGYAQLGVALLPGKLQALARFDTLDREGLSTPGRNDTWTLGLNGYFAPKTKLQLNLEWNRDRESGAGTVLAVLALFQAGF